MSEVGELNGNDGLESHLSALQSGIRDLRKTQKDLFERNQRLQCEIDRLHNQADVSVQPNPAKSGGKSNVLQMKVKELEAKVRRLKKVLSFKFDKRDCVALLIRIRLVLSTAKKYVSFN